MTVGTAQGLNLMASLEISAGTALAARTKWRARLIGVSLLGLGLAGMAEPAFADQNVLAADNGTVRCDASLKDLTRVTLLQQNLVGLEDTLAQSQGEIATGLIQVYRALGGGWELRCTGCNAGPAAAPGGADALTTPTPTAVPDSPRP